MKTTVSQSEFHDAFRAYDRMENFSYEGRNLIFDYLEEIESSTGTEMELDVIAICCDFNEDNWLDVARNYDVDLSDCEDDDAIRDTVRDYLNDNTMIVGETDTAVIYQLF